MFKRFQRLLLFLQRSQMNDAQWRKTIVQFATVKTMKVKQKRLIFNAMRSTNTNIDTFFPAFGLTAGEFCLFQILNETRKKS